MPSDLLRRISLAFTVALWACSDAPGTTLDGAGANTTPDVGTVTDAIEVAGLDLATADGGRIGGACLGSPGGACKSNEECSIGVCADDKNACTIDACLPTSFCGHTNKADGAACSDSSGCTGGNGGLVILTYVAAECVL